MFEKTQNLFVFLALIFGVAFVFAFPPLQTPDETTHFFRAYQVAEGGWISVKKDGLTGGELPRGLWDVHNEFSRLPGHSDLKVRGGIKGCFKLLGRPLDRGDRVFVHFPNTVSYPPLLYLPQAFGIFLGNQFGISALALTYAGRLGNLLAWIGIGYLTIRRASFFRFVILGLSLLPLSLQQASSLSADAMVNSVGLLYIVLCFRAALIKERMTNADLFWIGALSLAIPMMKQAYLPLLLLLGIIPREKYPGEKFAWAYRAFLGLGGLCVFGAWSYLVSRIAVPMKAEVEPLHQMQQVWQHPLEFLALLFRSYWINAYLFIQQFLGHLGWLDVLLPKALMAFLAISLLTLALCDQYPSLALSWRLKAFGLFVGALCAAAMSLAIWVTWNPASSPIIEGIQGRHFIPFALLGLIPLYLLNPKLRLEPKRLTLLSLTTTSVSLCWALATIFVRYYG